MARADLQRGTMFIQRRAEAGFSGVWQEKYAVLTSSYFAYYDSGAQFNRHRERPILKIHTSSIQEIQNIPQMLKAKHAMKVIWNADNYNAEELLLGFEEEPLLMKWSENIQEQILQDQEDTYIDLQEGIDHDVIEPTEPNETSETESDKNPPREVMKSSKPNESMDEELYEDMYCYHSPYTNLPHPQNKVSLPPLIPSRPSPAPRQRHVIDSTNVVTDRHTKQLATESVHGAGLTSTKARDNSLYSSEHEQSRRKTDSAVVIQDKGKSNNERIKNAGQLKRRMIVYAIHSHRSGADDELSFDVGDMIEVIREPGPSDWWCTGRIMSSLDEGLFPVNYVDRTGPKGSSGDLSETTYQALCVDTLNDNQDGDIYKSKEESETAHIELKKEDEELRVDLRATHRSLREHIQALKNMLDGVLYDTPPGSKGTQEADNFLQLCNERDLLTERLERMKKRFEYAISERDLYQTKLRLSEDKAESVQSSLDKALQINVVLKKKLSQLEQHRTRLDLRTMERDEARTLLAEAERLNSQLWNDIISLSEEMWRSKEAYDRALLEKEGVVVAATSAANEEKENRETIARELTIMKKRYSDRLSISETECRQLKERVSDVDKQLSGQKTKMDDAYIQLAEAQKELSGNSDTERNLARQVGCLREELDTLEAKYSTVLEEKKMAEEESRRLRGRLDKTSQTEASDDEDPSIVDDLRNRIKDLEEVNRRLEELQVLGEKSAANKM